MDPWPRGAVGGLEGPDFVVTPQRQRNFIKSLQQARAPARIDLEAVFLARRRDDRLRVEINPDAPGTLGDLDLCGEAVDDFLVDNDRENAVLEAVREKNVAKARADHGADAHLLQRPHRAFTRGAAAEIRSGDEDFRLPVRLSVQDEFRIFRTIRQITQRAKGPFTERAANGISDQPLDADDNVGIDIAAHDRGGDRGQFVEWLWHVSAPSSAHRQWHRRSRRPRRLPGSPDGSGPGVLGGRQSCDWRWRPSAGRAPPSRHWRQGTSSIRARAIRNRRR